MTTLEAQTTLVVEDCIACGVLFAFPITLQKKRKEDRKSFYCPNGHSMVYREGETARLKRELAKEARLREIAESNARHEAMRRGWAENSLRTTKGVVTKLRKRAADGACPCCNRYFPNMHRHMTTQHPDYAKEEEPPIGSQT
jgi:DNA repair exonuclease SbcCD ATPase subunit